MISKIKPFSKTELKFLVYNKVKRGMSYEKACEEVKNDIASCVENKKREKEIDKCILKKNKFREKFKKLKEQNE